MVYGAWPQHHRAPAVRARALDGHSGASLPGRHSQRQAAGGGPRPGATRRAGPPDVEPHAGPAGAAPWVARQPAGATAIDGDEAGVHCGVSLFGWRRGVGGVVRPECRRSRLRCWCSLAGARGPGGDANGVHTAVKPPVLRPQPQELGRYGPQAHRGHGSVCRRRGVRAG